MMIKTNIGSYVSQNMNLFFGMLCVFITAFPSAAFAQGDSPVSVKVTKKKMAVNENIVLEITATEEIEKFTPPVMSDFNVLSGPNQFTSMSYNSVNGRSRMERKTTISYILQPMREGEAVIGPASIVIDGKEHRTEGLTIEVGAAIQGQNSSSVSNSPLGSSMVNTPQNAGENIHLVASVSNPSPYIGEPVTVTYKLYYRVNIGQTHVNSMPKFDSFWTQNYQEKDLPRNGDERDYYKDELYHVATFYKVMLIPQKEGRHTISPLSVNMIAEVSTGQINYWGEEITRASQVSVNSNSLSINVRPLPQDGRPEDFDGAVGQYTMESSLSPSQLQAGTSATLSINIKGSGNIPLLHAPKAVFPQEIESYDPQTSQDVRLGTSSIQGEISEKYILIPRQKGSYTIPSVRFSYFNPKTGKYVTLQSGDKQLSVTGETAKTSAAPADPAAAEKTDVNYLNDDIRYIRHDNRLVPVNQIPWYDSWIFTLLSLLPLCLIPVIAGKRLYDKTVDRNSPASRAKRAAAQARKKLSRAKAALDKGDYATFYGEMEDAIYSFILDKLKIRRSDASIENIGGRLIARGADPHIAQRLLSVIESCQMARYAGFSSSTAQEDYTAACSAIEEVNKSIKN